MTKQLGWYRQEEMEAAQEEEKARRNYLLDLDDAENARLDAIEYEEYLMEKEND